MSDVQIAIIDQENIEVNLAVPGIQGAKGDTGTVAAAGDGIAAAPGISFASDTNTGIYRPGTDQLAISTGGTGRLFVDASGNVGVGVSPSAKLEVNGESRFTRSGASSQYVGIIADGTDTRIVAEGSSKNLLIKNNSTTSSAIFFDQAVASVYVFQQAGTERMRIRADGMFEVKGAGTAGSSPAFSVNGSAPASSLIIDSSGNASLGSASNFGSRRLSVNGIVSLQDGSAEKSYYYWDGTTTQLVTTGNNPTTFWTNSNERARIRGDGLFEIRGAGTAGSSPAFSVSGSAPANSCQLDSSGRLLVGTTSAPAGASIRLALNGTNGGGVEFVANNNGGGAIVPSSGGGLQFYTHTGAVGSETYSETARTTSDGYLRMAASTGGIQFNGDTAAANALDDYEEGTWTPALTRLTTAPTLTYSSQAGSYVKVGQMVFAMAKITISAVSANGSGLNQITGLPFTASSVPTGANSRWLGLVSNNSGLAAADSSYIPGGGTDAFFYDSGVGIVDANYVAGDLWISFTYRASA